MDAHIAQWIGKRSDQQDVYAVKHFPEGNLAIICDGMGGHCSGRAAASEASQAFCEHFAQGERGDIPSILMESLMAANAAVGKIFENDEEKGGCTLLAAFLTKTALWWISAGDSPLFVWRANQLTRVNQDHSMRSLFATEATLGTKLTRREVLSRGHMLRSAVMGDDIPLIDAPRVPFPLLPRDRVILSSDGIEDLLYPPILPPHLAKLLNEREAQLAPVIVDACRDLDEQYADNTTVVTFDV